MKKSIMIWIVLLLALSSITLAEVTISPKNPVINGNDYVLIIYNDSSHINTSVQINIIGSQSTLKKICNITLNEFGYGSCKYNFTSADIAGTWNYTINTSVAGTFEVGKINIGIADTNHLTSIKYGQKTALEVNLSYDNLMPKEILRTGINVDFGTQGTYNDYLDVNGDGNKEIIITTYDGINYIWNSINRLHDGTYRINGTDFRTNDFETLYYSSGCNFGDFDGDNITTMICSNNSGFIMSWKNINLSSPTSTTAAISFGSRDEGTCRGRTEICDVTGDGIYDQVMVGTYEGPYVLYNYNDTTGFTRIWNSSDYGSVQQDTYAVCADFDNDGYNEWVMTEYTSGNYFLDINRTGNLNVTMSVKATDRSNTYLGGAAIDFDNDKKIEFISRETGGRLQILEFNKSGTNLFEEDIPWGNDTDYTDFSYSASYIQFDDLNKNGRPDFVIVGQINQPPVLFYEFNPYNNSWNQKVIYGTNISNNVYQGIYESSYHVPAYVDFDGDGIREIMIFGRYSGNVYILKFNGEDWDLIYKGWIKGNEDIFSGEGTLYAAAPTNGWSQSKCAVGDMDNDSREEALCTPYDGNLFYYQESDLYEDNVTPQIYLDISINDGTYQNPEDKYTDIRLSGSKNTLCIKQNIAAGVTDIVDEDNQNQGNISPRWTDSIYSTEEFIASLQTANDYATLDANTVEDGSYSRIKLGNNYSVGKIIVSNYYGAATGRSYNNVIIKVTNDSRGNLCNFTKNTTIFDNSADGNNRAYSESYGGKTIYFDPQLFSCLRESTSGSSYDNIINNTANLRTEIQIFETEKNCSFYVSMNDLEDSVLSVKQNLTINVTAYDRTGNIINITSTLNIPVSWDALPFSTTIVGGTEYYPEQNGQIIIQLKDEFNDPVIGASCLVDYYYPNMSLWLNDQSASELADTGIYYNTFTVPSVDGVYIAFVNCTSGAFSDTDSHTFHVSGILLNINSTVNNISQIVDSINRTISTTIIGYLSQINLTTTDAENYTQNIIYPSIIQINSTASDVLFLWEGKNISYLYDKLNQTYYLVNATNNATSGLMTKWGTYTASQIYLLLNDTYNRTDSIYTNMATQSNISAMINDTAWLRANMATSANVSDLMTIMAGINSSIEVISSDINGINDIMQSQFDSIQENLSWMRNNVALSSNITTILNNLTTIINNFSWISNNTATQRNVTSIIQQLAEINSTIKAVNSNMLYVNESIISVNNSIISFNDSISSQLSAITNNITWLISNIATQNNITGIRQDIETLASIISSQNNTTALITVILGLNNSISGLEENIYSFNESVNGQLSGIRNNITLMLDNTATQQNITQLYSTVDWLTLNVATQQNISLINQNLQGLNVAIIGLTQNTLDLNSSLNTQMNQLNTSISWLTSNVALQENISNIQSNIDWLINNTTQSNSSNTIALLQQINDSIKYMHSDFLEINSSIQSQLGDINSTLIWLEDNVALQSNLGSINSDLTWMMNNIMTEDNLSIILDNLIQINDSVNVLKTNMQYMNASNNIGFENILSNLSSIINNMTFGEMNSSIVLERLMEINYSVSAANEYLTQNMTLSLNSMNSSMTEISDYLTININSSLININNSVNNISQYLSTDLTGRITELNNSIANMDLFLSSDINNELQEINSTIHYVNSTTNQMTAIYIDSINQTLYYLDSYIRTEISDSINRTLENSDNALALIGNSSDNETAETLFGEQAYTRLALTSIQSNLTWLNGRISGINTSLNEINITITGVLSEITSLEQLQQCNTTNTTICELLWLLRNDTQNIYSVVLNSSNLTASPGSKFSITGLVAGSPRYANEEVLLEATFAGMDGSAINPDSLNLTIYDPNDNVWAYTDINNFTKLGDIWRFTKSISSNPTTGMYSAHLSGIYDGVENARVVQFRIATGGPYKVYVDCPSSSYVGQDLTCAVIIQDEGEAATESITTVWLDTNNNGVNDTGESKVSFSKRTEPLQTLMESVNINVPYNHPTGLYMIQAETEYVNSAQPNSKASDAVILAGTAATTSTPSSRSGGGSSGSSSEYIIVSTDIAKDNITNNLTGYTSIHFQQEVVCNTPYIRKGVECCLDINSNFVCDYDEIESDDIEAEHYSQDSHNEESPTAITSRMLQKYPDLITMLPYFMLMIILVTFILVLVLMPTYVKRMRKAFIPEDDEKLSNKNIEYNTENTTENSIKPAIKEASIESNLNDTASKKTTEKHAPEKLQQEKASEIQPIEDKRADMLIAKDVAMTPIMKTTKNVNIDIHKNLEDSKNTLLNPLPKTDSEVYGEKRFFLNDGIYISSLTQLVSVLENMDVETFNRHVNNQKNDFYNWIKEVFKDEQLAGKIKDIGTKKDMANVILEHILIKK